MLYFNNFANISYNFGDEPDPVIFQNISGYADIIDQIKERDERDKTRSSSPLIAASDAKVFDTSNLSIKEAIDHVLYYIQTKIWLVAESLVSLLNKVIKVIE